MKSFVDRTKVRPDGTLIVQAEAEEIVPYTINEAERAVLSVMNGKGVVFRLEGLPVGTAQRMLDFVSGAVFALNGEVRKIKGEKYLLIPQNVKIRRVRERK